MEIKTFQRLFVRGRSCTATSVGINYQSTPGYADFDKYSPVHHPHVWYGHGVDKVICVNNGNGVTDDRPVVISASRWPAGGTWTNGSAVYPVQITARISKRPRTGEGKTRPRAATNGPAFLNAPDNAPTVVTGLIDWSFKFYTWNLKKKTN